MNYKMNVTIKNPQTQKGMYSCLQFSFICHFLNYPDKYCNGYYVKIEPVQNEYSPLYIDLRDDKSFNCDNKFEWLCQWAKNYWNGVNGAWIVDKLEIQQLY